MDFVNKFTGGGNSQSQGQTSNEQVHSSGSAGGQQQSSGGFLGGIGDKLNSAAGGGRESEKNEDYVDKGEFICLRISIGRVLTRHRCRLRTGEVPRSRPPG